MPLRKSDRLVLLIGGPSGVGESVFARALGLRFGVPWLQVDDFRLALQYSHATLPQRTQDLYFFLDTPDVWSREPQQLCDALIGVGEIMAPAIDIVVANHGDRVAPAILEGDGILPAVFAQPRVRDRSRDGSVQAVFLVELDQDMIYVNVVAWGRGVAGRGEAELRNEAQAKWQYGQWLTAQAALHGLPVLEPRPWTTLADRIIALCGSARRSEP